MLETKNKCPKCRYTGQPQVLKLYSKEGYDPQMLLVKCLNCGLKYEIAPPPWYREED